MRTVPLGSPGYSLAAYCLPFSHQYAVLLTQSAPAGNRADKGIPLLVPMQTEWLLGEPECEPADSTSFRLQVSCDSIILTAAVHFELHQQL